MSLNNKKKMILILVGVMLIIIIGVIAVSLGIRRVRANDLGEKLSIGNKYLEEMDYDQAKAVFTEAITIDPDSANAYLGLADAYTGLGEEDEAQEVLLIAAERIRSIEPEKLNTIDNWEKVYATTAEMYIEQGKYQQAEEIINTAKSQDISQEDSENEIFHEIEEEIQNLSKNDPSEEKSAEDEQNEKEEQTVSDNKNEVNWKELYVQYVQKYISPYIPLAQMENVILEKPNLESVGTEDPVLAYQELYGEYQQELAAHDGILGIYYKDLDQDGVDEMLIASSIMTEDITPEHKFKVEVYRIDNEEVKLVDNLEILLPFGEDFPCTGNVEEFQFFIKENERKPYIGILGHTYGAAGTGGEYGTSTSFMIYSMEDGVLVCNENFTEYSLTSIYEYKNSENGDCILNIEKNPEGDIKEAVYEKLSPYGFTCSWMDDYFDNVLSDEDPFAGVISLHEDQVTDWLSFHSICKGESKTTQGCYIFRLNTLEYTEFIETNEQYGFVIQ